MIQKSTAFLFLSLCLNFNSTACQAQDTDLVADGAEVTLVAEGYSFTEGPAVDKYGNVFFTDQPNDQIIRWDAADNSVAVFMKPSGRSNGMYFDNEGNLLACADQQNQLWQIDPETKNVTVLVNDFGGKKLNGPNDLWVDAKGGIYFTDPFYKRPWWDHTEKEIEQERVYYRTPFKGEIKIAADGFVRPNGIVGAPDGKTLYVADSGGKKTYSFTINKDASLSDKKLFTDLGSDGMTLDNQGNVYLTGDGITVFNAKGEQIHHITVPEKRVTNVVFAGPDQNLLFITAMDSAYTLKMKVNGVR